MQSINDRGGGLSRAARAGTYLDADRIEALFRTTRPGIVAYFRRRTADRATADDLAAETFATALQDRHQFRGHGTEQATAWLYGIARHQLASFHRRREREQRAVCSSGWAGDAREDGGLWCVEEALAAPADRAAVRRAVRSLTPATRQALWLRVVREASYEEVAHRLGVSEQTARARVSRALRHLALRLERLGARRQT